jgi:LacI family transcriptional regulator
LSARSFRKRKPTQADVARLAGVSQALVSYVLNDNPMISIPAHTRQRILDAIDELGYVPDGAARSLRTRKTYTIAGIIPDITNPFYPAFERGIQESAESHGYDLIVYNTGSIAERERRCLRSVQQGRVDGVIAVLFHVTARDLVPLMNRGIAVVRLEARKKKAREYELPLDNLYVDNIAAARDVVRYLIGRGHTRIGMLDGIQGPGRARVLGYRQALAEHRLPVDEALIRDGDFKEDGGYRAMDELLELSPRPTAVFAANDMMAMGALVAVREAGLAIPRDVALVGFDDTPASRLVTPPLTTVTQFQERLGRRAAEMLFERLDGRAPEHGRYEEMPYELILRGSA